ncbi:MAG: acyl carrier protein [Nitrospirota bacterium]
MGAEAATNIIAREIIKALSEELGVPLTKITQETLLIEDLGIDSFRAVELMFLIKEAFDIEYSPEDFRKARKVKDIVAYVASKQ